MSGPIFHRSPMQPSRSLIRPTSNSSPRELVSSSSWVADFPVIFTTSSLVVVFPWNGIPTVVTGAGSDALTVPIGVLKVVETSPISTHPMVRPSRLIGMPTVSCFTVSLVPSIVGPLPSATMKGVALHLLVRPSLCTANAPRPAMIAAMTRSGTHLEMTVGKTSDCKDHTQPRIQIDNTIPTSAATMFQRKLATARPVPELVSVRKTRPRKNKLKPTRSTETEYCWIPSGPLMSQTRPRMADIPPNVAAARRCGSERPESRPTSIHLFRSERFAHQCQSPGEDSPSLGEFVASLVAVGN